MRPTTGEIKAIWRYPIKSILGEQLSQIECEPRGLKEDRRFAIVNPQGKIASGKDTRRFFHLDGLFELSASTQEDGSIQIRFPDGSSCSHRAEDIHERLSAHFRQPLQLVEEQAISHLDEGPLHIVLTQDLDVLARKHGSSTVEACRFRPNLIASWDLQDHIWEKGQIFSIGGALFSYSHPTERCRMVTYAQQGIPQDKALLKSIASEAGVYFGFYANIEKAGRITAEDAIHFVER
ncbi:MAG: MOSC N-terminal beta barrel domain-containing protein [Myxococcales bacterium]|nr:MOSC N-terminal beta barrel domain-containing protein [Myxococcales bacterium]